MRTLLIFLCGLSAGMLPAQQPDTLAPVLDTLGIQAASPTVSQPKKPGLVRRILTKDYPNPRTAVLLSLALPGSGQMYNKKWWKVPIVYAALGAFTYFEIDNLGEYRRLRDNYKWLVDGDPNTNPTEFPYNQLDAVSMKGYRDQWRRYVELTSVGLGLAYILTATEAFVDAHLSRFDVGDDLSMRLIPKMLPMPEAGLAIGLGLRLEFGTFSSVRERPPSAWGIGQE